MSNEDYQRALAAAVREYEALGVERRNVDKRLAELVQTISTLNRLCGIAPTVAWGLTDSCRYVVRTAGHPVTPTEVRDRLEAMGMDLSKYSSSLAAIHTILKRLREAGELAYVEVTTGKFAYEWAADPKASSRAINESALRELEIKRKKKRRR
jgi:hypothetical protein